MRERVTFSRRGTREDGDAGDAGDATKEWSSSSNTSFTGECHYSYADEVLPRTAARKTALCAPPLTESYSRQMASRSTSVSLERNPTESMSSSGASSANGNALNNCTSLSSSSMVFTVSLVRMPAPA